MNHTVIAVARTKEGLEKLQAECKLQNSLSKVFCFVFDLERSDMKGLAGEIKKRVGTLDILINNAGMFLAKPFEQVTREELQKVYEVNVFGIFRLIQHMVPLMTKRSHISSMGGMQGSQKFAGFSAYSSSKGALAVLAECLALELKPKKIFVNCLCLGAVDTDMLRQAFPKLRGAVSAGQMSEYIAWFALNGQKFFNGKVIPVSPTTP
jgi:NAD(P)-dependent dehydrogenase (short-subunit alcohol dehydrogenase family)